MEEFSFYKQTPRCFFFPPLRSRNQSGRCRIYIRAKQTNGDTNIIKPPQDDVSAAAEVTLSSIWKSLLVARGNAAGGLLSFRDRKGSVCLSKRPENREESAREKIWRKAGGRVQEQPLSLDTRGVGSVRSVSEGCVGNERKQPGGRSGGKGVAECSNSPCHWILEGWGMCGVCRRDVLGTGAGRAGKAVPAPERGQRGKEEDAGDKRGLRPPNLPETPPGSCRGRLSVYSNRIGFCRASLSPWWTLIFFTVAFRTLGIR